MSRGTFKYICDECNEETWLSRKSRNSRFRPRCIRCGSTFLTPSKRSIASDKIAEIRDIQYDFKVCIDKKMNKPSRCQNKEIIL